MEDNFFVKTSEVSPVLTTEQKSQLNRRGNEYFNAGNIDMAAKIFTTTGYSDGLSRIADYYYGENKKLEALKYYKLAHNNHNVDIIVHELVSLLRLMI